MKFEQHLVWDLVTDRQRQILKSLTPDQYEKIIESIRSDVEILGISYKKSINEVIGE